MAAAPIAEPGSAFGPCVDECEHIDCAATKAQAASACTICAQPLGYDEPVYDMRSDSTRKASPLRRNDYGDTSAWRVATIDYWSQPHFAHADCLEAQQWEMIDR